MPVNTHNFTVTTIYF